MDTVTTCEGCDYDDDAFHSVCTVCTRMVSDEGNEDFYEQKKEIKMAVLLDIDMPDSCNECPLYDEERQWCIVGTNGCPDRLIKHDRSFTKPEWCPIVDEASVPTVRNLLVDLTLSKWYDKLKEKGE